MSRSVPTKELKQFAEEYEGNEIAVHRAMVEIDERQDGESVTRVTLLVDDPADDTWSVEGVRNLRQALGRRAAELDLPSVSLTLVPTSEAEAVEAFAG